GVGPGDRFIARTLARASVPVTIALNKVDRCTEPATVAELARAAELDPEADVFPVSARTGDGVPALAEHLKTLMPPGPFLFEHGTSTDQPLRVVLAELIREAGVRRTFHELPHAVEVVIDDIEDAREGLTVIRALIWVET